MALGNRVGVMDNGALQQLGTPQALYERPANMFVAGFIGSPAMNMFAGALESDEGGLFFTGSGSGFRVPVPEHLARRLADWAGAQVVMGLRPEDIHDARFLPDADPATIVRAEVQLRESLGSDIHLHLTAGRQEFVARLDNRTEARPGDCLDVVFDTANIHMFDPAKGRTLL
jgi:multiple sugar transport system ATP-binding protein